MKRKKLFDYYKNDDTYYGEEVNDMSKITKQRKVRRRLRVVRLLAYTAVSFTILQYVGVFALAGIRGVYVKTESKLNAFYPKTYVNVELEENDGGKHDYVLKKSDDKYEVVTDTTANEKQKKLKVINPGTNKKDILVRAKIAAVIYNEDGIVVGETQDYEITGTALINEEDGELTVDDVEKGMWYRYNSQVNTNKYSATDNDSAYFYYTSILEKDTETTNLFDSVKLTSIDNIPDNGWVEFNVIVDTVEVEKNSDGTYNFDKAKSAWGTNNVLIGALVTAQSSSTTTD